MLGADRKHTAVGIGKATVTASVSHTDGRCWCARAGAAEGAVFMCS